MLIDLLSIYAIVWIIKTAVEDTAHAVKGTPNPRYELKRQKALAAGRPAPTQPRYGSREWLADLVSDALVANTERRRRKAAEKAKASGNAGKPLDDLAKAVGVSAAKGAGEMPEKPAFRLAEQGGAPSGDVRVAGQRPTATAGGQPDRAAGGQAGPVSAVNGHTAVSRPTSPTPAPTPTPAPVSRPVPPTRPDPAAPETPATGNQPNPTPTPQQPPTTRPDTSQPADNPTPAKPADSRPLAPVIPLFNTPKKEDMMPTVDGEVTGLDPAISYARALARFAGEHGQAGNEGYIAFLTDSKVTGPGLETANEMQEAFANAAAAAERHAAQLEKQKTVQEAYEANPDAGTKEFLLGGR